MRIVAFPPFLFFLAVAFAARPLPGPGPEEYAFSIHVTGADQGILEPCGCSGGQLGGIARRGTLLETLTYGEKPHLILATGGLAGGTDALHVIRFEILLLCLEAMHYEAVGLGPEELALGLDELAEASELVDLPFLLTNVRFPGREPPLPFQTAFVKEAAGYRVRVMAFIPPSLASRLPEGARYLPPAAAVRSVLSRSGPADFTVALLRGTREEAKALDPALPDPKVIFYSYPHSEPRVHDFFEKEGPIRWLSPGDRGRYIISCRVGRGKEGGLEPFAPVEEPIDLDYPQSREILGFMEWYRGRVLDEKVLEDFVERTPPPAGAPYVGTGTCALCHEKTFDTWRQSGHAHAYETLVKVKRDFDPECLSCHTVGLGFRTGFRNPKETPYLLGVGCEACHGPCAMHVASGGATPPVLKPDCTRCHNMDHSPEFDRAPYWDKIRCSPDGAYHLPPISPAGPGRGGPR